MSYTSFFMSFFFFRHRWLYRPAVQQQQPPQSNRKTRRNDPPPTPTPLVTTNTATTSTGASAGAEPASNSVPRPTATTTANHTRSSTNKALRTIPEEVPVSNREESEESEGELTQPQFVTQPELTQPAAQIIRGKLLCSVHFRCYCFFVFVPDDMEQEMVHSTYASSYSN